MKFSQKLTGPNRAVEDLTRSNSLFLSCAAQNSHKVLSEVHEWFMIGLTIVQDGERAYPPRNFELFKRISEDFKAVRSLLAGADIGVDDFEFTPEPKLEEVLYPFTKRSTPEKLRLIHNIGGQKIALSLEDESKGTVALLGLLKPLTYASILGQLLCIDELDASLHSHLAIDLVKRFTSSTNKHQAQLLFNTHDTNLLSADVLRRDQIWLTEKGSDGASTLYPLTDFKPRAQENLEKGYLQGRYGAIPFINADEFFPVLKAANGKKR